MHGTIDKLIPWADDGGTQVVAISDVKVERGWNVGEQPPAQWENWRVNRDNNKINELADILILNSESEYADTIADKCSGIPNVSRMLDPRAAVNRLESAVDGERIKFICRGYDYTQNIECVFALLDNEPDSFVTIRKIYNASDGTIETKDVLTEIVVLGAGYMRGICCDGNYIYLVQYKDSTHFLVYKVSLGAAYAHGIDTNFTHLEVSSTYIPNKGYHGNGGASGNYLCVADANTVAVFSTTGIVMVDKDMGSYVKGTGTYGAINTGTWPTLAPWTYSGICSDGLRVWYSAYAQVGSTDEYAGFLCAALISDPTSTTAGLERNWTSDPAMWQLFDDITSATANRNVVCDLIYTGSGICALMDHAKYDGVSATDYAMAIGTYDLESESFMVASHLIPCGHSLLWQEDPGTITGSDGAMCFTGRRIACAIPTNINDNSYISGFYDQSVVFVDPFVGLVDDYQVTTRTAEIGSAACTAIQLHEDIHTNRRRIRQCVFADDCLWVVSITFVVEHTDIDAASLIRIPTVSARR